jgi:hypothetical protein
MRHKTQDLRLNLEKGRNISRFDLRIERLNLLNYIAESVFRKAYFNYISIFLIS